MKYLYQLFAFEEVYFAAVAVLRMVLAAVLGAIIGYEREHTNRPAGIRTHTLVCLGAALVMVTGEFLAMRYQQDIDPTRLGAQVVSGIGFLGAGTILKEGVTVRGLTTAGCIWATSCVGLAAGSGFYVGAIITTALIYLTLSLLKKKYFHTSGNKEMPNSNQDSKAINDSISDLMDDDSIVEERE